MNSVLKVLPSNCDCEKCSNMCKAPCCGTPEDFRNLIDNGFGNRLMIDDWLDEPPMLKPAMKGSESRKAPWETRTEKGCTFWHNGKCDLHNSGLKPTQGKLALHAQSEEECDYIREIIVNSWETEDADTIIEEWTKNFYSTKYSEMEKDEV